MASYTVFGTFVLENGWRIVAALFCIMLLTVLANFLQQTLFGKADEPPVVFHWLPVIGSTVTYGIDPFKFFFECQAKVCTSISQHSFENLSKVNADTDYQVR